MKLDRITKKDKTIRIWLIVRELAYSQGSGVQKSALLHFFANFNFFVYSVGIGIG